MAERLLAVFVAVAMTLMGQISIASAQDSSNCTQYESMQDYLQRQFGEYSQHLGVSSTGAQLEIFARPDGATWSAVVVFSKDGLRIGCLVDSGENWRTVEVEPGERS